MRTRVLIVGGGAGGTILTNSLNPRHFDVKLISASAEHMFQPALLYVATSNARADITRPEHKLLRRHVRLLEARVVSVDLTERVVTTSDGGLHSYDEIVLATGITTDPGQIPGLREVNDRFGDYHSSVPQARKLWRTLDAFRGGTIAVGQSSPVCKCPPSPIEGVLLIDRLLRDRGLRDRTRLVFFTPYPRAYSAEPMNQIVEPILEQRSIEVMTFFDVDHVDPATGTIRSIEGDEITCDIPVLIPPFVGADIHFSPADVIDESRLVLTDRSSLRVRGVEHAFAIGDGTNLPTSKSGVGAHLEAKVVARALSGRPAAFAGRTHCPFDLGDGRGTFVTSSYRAPTVKARPSRAKHAMKMAFARLYWVSLRGWLDPAIDLYFRFTRPPEPAPTAPPPRVPVG